MVAPLYRGWWYWGGLVTCPKHRGSSLVRGLCARSQGADGAVPRGTSRAMGDGQEGGDHVQRPRWSQFMCPARHGCGFPSLVACVRAARHLNMHPGPLRSPWRGSVCVETLEWPFHRLPRWLEHSHGQKHALEKGFMLQVRSLFDTIRPYSWVYFSSLTYWFMVEMIISLRLSWLLEK